MAIDRWRPFPELMPVREMMDRLLEGASISPWRVMEREGWLGVDLYEQDDAYHLEVPLPGVRPEDVEISTVGNTVTISGEIPCRATGERTRRLLHERACGTFRRSVTLPSGVDPDRAEARFEAGMLRLTIPKSEAARTRRIPVKTAQG